MQGPRLNPCIDKINGLHLVTIFETLPDVAFIVLFSFQRLAVETEIKCQCLLIVFLSGQKESSGTSEA